MDTAWQTSVDRMLRNTGATLENLQGRRRSYDRAKNKVDDYLGLATPHRDSKDFDSLDRTDLSVPPPLPQHRRYRTARDGAYNGGAGNMYGTGTPGPSPPVDLTAPAQQPAKGRRGIAAAARADDPTAPLQLVNAQVRGAMLELELEKAKRADSIRELAYRTTAELAELRSMITQLQDENVSLRKSVRALEGKLGFAPDSKPTSQLVGAGKTSVLNGGASHASFSELGPQLQHPSRAAQLASAVANSGFGLGPDVAAPAAGGGAASLAARIDALESGLARQQQLAEERQTRTATVLREMVKAEVGSDMAQVRTVAREAARDSTEDLVKLRLAAMQSSVQTDVQRAVRAAAASETAAQQAQQQCSEAEHRLSAQIQKLNLHFLDGQRGSVSGTSSPNAAGAPGGVVAYAAPASQERLLHLEGAVEEELHGLRGQLRQLRQDTETHLERLAQEQKQTHAQLQGKANAQDLRDVANRVEEQQQQYSSIGGVGAGLREHVHSTVRAQLQPVHDAVQKLQESTQEQQETAEAWRRQTGLRFAAVEASTRDFRDEADRQDQQWSSGMQELRQVRAEAAAVQARATEALQQCMTELTSANDAKLQTLEKRLLASQRERQQQWEQQVRQLQQSVEEQREMSQRTRSAGDAAEERLRRVEAAVASVESTLPNGIAGMKARCDALQTLLQQSCALPLLGVQQDVEVVQRRLQALDEDKTRSNVLWAQQLTDAKQFFEERVRNTRDMLEQRLSHQKELYEELRSQQNAQRRYTEEQQQLVLDQVKRLQPQQQTGSGPVPVPLPAAVTTGNVSERQASSLAAPAAEERSAATVSTPTTAATAVDAEAFHKLQRQVQGLYPQLQSVEQRVEAAAAKAAENTSATVASAIAPLQSRLDEMQEQVQLCSKEQQLRLSEVDRALSAKLRVISTACDRLPASTAEQLGRVREDIASATSPFHLVTNLAADPDSLQRLAAELQDHLDLPLDMTRTLRDVQAKVAQQVHAIDELRAVLRETHQQMAAVQANAAAERTAAQSATENEATVSPQDVTATRAEMQTALQALQQRQAALEQQTQQLAAAQLPALAGEVDGIKQATESLPQSLQQLTDQYTALQAAQRQQLPTLQKYVQDVLEVVQENQAALLDPLQLKLRTVEERHKKLQVRLDEWMEEQEASLEQAGEHQKRQLGQARAEWETRAAAQLAAVQDSVTSLRTNVTDLEGKLSLMEKQRETEAEEKRQLREDVGAVAQAVKQKIDNATSADTVAPSSAEALPTTAAAATTAALSPTAPSVAQLQSYMEELDGRLSQLEEQTNDSLAVTADALGAFGEQLQDVVTRFDVAVREAEADEGAASPSSSSAAVIASGGGAIRSLEDVFTYLLLQLRQLQQALYRLQDNTVETLEILEQHEESTAALPTLQHNVEAIAAALVPLAERLGVDVKNLLLPLTSPRDNVDVYPPSHASSSDSSSSSSGGGSLDDGRHVESAQ
ncbi:hypothetical protein ABB37_02182 [Leptomonas pyrrhocoris]|uniref:Uncharacterized protein n=1 Tax=Leptomonas pyrrhocoris TaxID=157538 RepID=A0A0M9G790_LEPPY|nr:hypothetical protein ABB37_02182 [Leptomonas pyrrhocoris]XP_015662509.1 hypothetical protein ABB37_02182 [Leptomonas pyrrhocoris]KPA84069.1 hypothetical protein ABB37_02182 [Leptomonas pyrrhocoris]KPA84070.1 hypothetical protein ABB37_02182 [Leptomonas pyrrhocoris]|eukprot:XP_015662508.1 hypothetical protein ABB37_02182 [Leptomonas pyrrhocoris]